MILRFVLFFRYFSVIQICFALFTMSSACGLDFTVEDIGTLAADRSDARDINDFGQIVGSYTVGDRTYPFLYTPGQGIEVLDLPEGAMPTKINNVGQIIGYYRPSNSSFPQGFFWDSIQGFKGIGTLDGGTASCAMDLNDHGQVVGSATINGDQVHRAILWQDGNLTNLGVLNENSDFMGSSGAVGINNEGVIVGTSAVPVIHKGKLVSTRQKVVVWRNGQNAQDLQPEFRGDWVQVKGFTDTGKILVHKTQAIKPSTNYILDINTGDELVVGPSCIGLNNQTIFTPQSIFTISEYKISSEFYLFDHMKQSEDPDFGWRKIEIRGANNRQEFIGVATNSFGKTHAVVIGVVP